MILRCKEGDIAVVEHDDPPCLDNVRHVVRVLGALRFDRQKKLHTWLIEPLSTNYWLVCNWPQQVKADWRTRAECLATGVEHADAYLRPIRKTGFNSLADIIELTQKPSESFQENLRESLRDVLP